MPESTYKGVMSDLPLEAYTKACAQLEDNPTAFYKTDAGPIMKYLEDPLNWNNHPFKLAGAMVEAEVAATKEDQDEKFQAVLSFTRDLLGEQDYKEVKEKLEEKYKDQFSEINIISEEIGLVFALGRDGKFTECDDTYIKDNIGMHAEPVVEITSEITGATYTVCMGYLHQGVGTHDRLHIRSFFRGGIFPIEKIQESLEPTRDTIEKEFKEVRAGGDILEEKPLVLTHPMQERGYVLSHSQEYRIHIDETGTIKETVVEN